MISKKLVSKVWVKQLNNKNFASYIVKISLFGIVHNLNLDFIMKLANHPNLIKK